MTAPTKPLKFTCEIPNPLLLLAALVLADELWLVVVILGDIVFQVELEVVVFFTANEAAAAAAAAVAVPLLTKPEECIADNDDDEFDDMLWLYGYPNLDLYCLCYIDSSIMR